MVHACLNGSQPRAAPAQFAHVRPEDGAEFSRRELKPTASRTLAYGLPPSRLPMAYMYLNLSRLAGLIS